MNYFLDVPAQIKISLSNVCNYKCVMCPNSILKQKRGYISDDLVYKILDECAELGVKNVSLGGTGEPLVHKNFIPYLKRAKSLGLHVSTTTNCSLLSREMTEALVAEGLDRLCLSVYSSDDESHWKYTGTNLFSRVVENIKYFLNYWYENRSSMEVNMWFLSIPGVNERAEFMAYWGPVARRVGLPLTIKEPINWGGRVDLYKEKISAQLLCIEKKEKGYKLVHKKQIRCQHVNNYLFVLHDGTVLPCCNIQEGDEAGAVVFGNLIKDSIMDVWKSPKYLSFKEDHLRKKTSGYPYCRDCSDVICFLSWNLNPLRYLPKLASFFNHRHESV